jgi:citrate synthase
MESWRTAIVSTGDGNIRIRGYDVTELMTRATFTDTIFLLQRGRLPSAGERKLLDALLTGCADHGSGAPSCAAARLAASGNRASLSAAVAAGLLAVGDEHGGAGEQCMEMIARGVAKARAESVAVATVAARELTEAKAAGRKVPGLGHRVHKTRDPRTNILFGIARAEGLAGDGVAFMEGLESALEQQGKTLPVNIDGALAAILYDLGFEPPAGKLMFIVARVAGLAAEVAEEHRREKPMRIRIPVEYDGEPPREI